MELNLVCRRKTVTVEVNPNCTVEELKRTAISHCKLPKSIHRISIKYVKDEKTVRLSDDSKTLKDYDIVKNFDCDLAVRDIGPQFSYRGVFFWEYFGPFAIMAIFALRPAFIYGEGASVKPYSCTAKAAIIMFLCHYVKRELETFFVHRFSRATMPLTNLFKNCSYYWSFAALIAYPLCHPDFTAAGCLNKNIWMVAFILAELGNFRVHMYLRNLRPAELSKERPIPSHWLFKFVSCPNYTCEVAAWIAFAFMTRIAMSYIFALVGLLQMTQWALQKHRGYVKKENYRKLGRKAIIPFLV
eukprot:TRINITY_DN780029_c0_g1_i1.p1 TRINITY_DN780029_c0_g1~~TRINITY_DN780029_c0_g1_i1.p1  ORF type:complete len:308 (-),score=59.63 TRINITY_DN780029_c0_g1_i1:181-1080(-)